MKYSHGELFYRTFRIKNASARFLFFFKKNETDGDGAPNFPVKRDDCIGGRWARLSTSSCCRKSSWRRRSAAGEKDGKERKGEKKRGYTAVSIILSIIITQTILISNPPSRPPPHHIHAIC